MNGPEHYSSAEQWLRYASEHYTASGDGDPEVTAAAAVCAAIGQAHATLALAAATAVQPWSYGYERPEAIEWHKVAAVEKPDGAL